MNRAPVARVRVLGILVGALGGLGIGVALMELGAFWILGTPVVTALLCCAAAGALPGALGRSVWLVPPAGALAVLLLIVAATPMAGHLGRRWIREDSLPAAPLDAVIALGSGVRMDTVLDAAGTARMLTALELHRQGVAPRVLTTTVVLPASDGTLSTTRDQQNLATLARATGALTVLGVISSTRDEAVLAARTLLPSGERRLVVVTTPMHTRRACSTFEKVGFQVVCVAARERDRDRRRPVNVHDRLAAFQAYMYERAGSWLYRRRGWI